LDVLVLNLASRLVDDRAYGRPVEHTVLDFSDHTLDLLRLERTQVIDVMEQADNEYLQIFEQLLPSKHSAQGKVRPN
jgi:hypothetical protein